MPEDRIRLTEPPPDSMPRPFEPSPLACFREALVRRLAGDVDPPGSPCLLEAARAAVDDPAAGSWAEGAIARLLAWDDDAARDGQARFAHDADGDLAALVPRSLPVDDEVWLALLTAVVLSGRPVLPAWERLVPFVDGEHAALLDRLPPAQRDAILLAGFERGTRRRAIEDALTALGRRASRPLAEALASALESPTLRAVAEKHDIARWQQRWATLLDRSLAKGEALGFRPLDPAAVVTPPPVRAPAPPPERTHGSLRGKAALDDLASFAALSRADRLAVAAEVAAELGPAFVEGPMLVGAAELAVVVHRASGYALLLVPGMTFEQGLTDADWALFSRYFGLESRDREWQRIVAEHVAEARPTRVVRVPPSAFGRTLPDDEMFPRLDEPAVAVACAPVADGAEALAIAASIGFRLPSESAWEHVAREGQGSAFVRNLAEVYFDGAEPPETSVFGVDDLGPWEWVADRWHPTYDGAPLDGRAWTEGHGPHVLRGGGTNGYLPYAEDLPQALVARRRCPDGGGTAGFARHPFRLALGRSPDGVWRFPDWQLPAKL